MFPRTGGATLKNSGRYYNMGKLPAGAIITLFMRHCLLCSENAVFRCVHDGNWAQWPREIAYEKSIAALVRSGAYILSGNEQSFSACARYLANRVELDSCEPS